MDTDKEGLTPGDEVPAKATTNPDRLNLLKSRLSLAKTFCKKAHDSWKKELREYGLEDMDDTSEIRDRTRIPYLFRKTETDVAAIFDDKPDLFITGKNAPTEQIEPLIDGTYDFLWDVQDLEEKIEDLALYFKVCGMAFLESPWVTKTKKVMQSTASQFTQQQQENPQEEQQEESQEDPTEEATETPAQEQVEEEQEEALEVPVIDNPDATVLDLFKTYFSPETKFGPIMDYDHCPYYFVETLMSPDQVQAKFGVEVTATETLQLDDTDLDSDIESDKSIMKEDLKRVKVYKYIGCLPEDTAPANSNWTYDKDYRIYFTPDTELQVIESPDDTKPLFILGNYGRANRFFKFGDAHVIMPLIQELQQYRDQLLRYTRKMVNPKVLTPTASEIDKDALIDPSAGRLVDYTGEPPTFMEPPKLGDEVETGIEMARVDLEKSSGSFDLSSGGSQSEVRTPKGIQVYSEAADRNVARQKKKIARFIKHLIEFQFNQLATNWRPEDGKVISVVDPDGGPQGVQVTQEVLQVLGGVGQLYNLDIEVESLSLNRVQMKQDALNLWEAAEAHPEIFNLPEIAKDLLQNGYGKKDADRYLISEEQRAQMQQNAAPKPTVSVSIKADAATPQGLQLLENEQLIQPGQAQQMQVTQHVIQQVQNQPLLDAAATGSTQPLPNQPGQTPQPMQ